MVLQTSSAHATGDSSIISEKAKLAENPCYPLGYAVEDSVVPVPTTVQVGDTRSTDKKTQSFNVEDTNRVFYVKTFWICMLKNGVLLSLIFDNKTGQRYKLLKLCAEKKYTNGFQLELRNLILPPSAIRSYQEITFLPIWSRRSPWLQSRSQKTVFWSCFWKLSVSGQLVLG